MKLRPHQLAAVKATWRELEYRQSTAVVHSTGSGKTHCVGATARVHYHRGGERVLFVAPRGELLDQAEKTILAWNPGLRNAEICREQGELRAHSGAKLILASSDSLSTSRLRSLPAPDLLLIDEAHLQAMGSQLRIIKRFPKVKRVGYTATPDRLDGAWLFPHLFESCAHTYEVGETIADGYLVPPVFRARPIQDLDLSAVTVTTKGDFKAASLSKVMRRPEHVKQTADFSLQEVEERSTIVFACDVPHAAALVEAMNAIRPGCARAIDGTASPNERRDFRRDFENGVFQLAVTVMLYTYGIDLPLCSAIVLARPTLSRALYSQMIGRGLRLLGDSFEESVSNGKADCLVLDLVGNAHEHRLITPDEYLAPRPEASPTIEMLVEAEEPVDLEGLEGLIDEALEEEEQEELLAEIVAPAAAYRVVAVDSQLSVVGIDPGPRRAGDAPATALDLSTLRALGLDEGAEELSHPQAEVVIHGLRERLQQGFCSLGQARLLMRKGLHPNANRQVADTFFELMEELGWPRKIPWSELSGELRRELTYTGKRTLRLATA
ncbi:MAG: DEAD/DEAH box helicase [Deltaproteobacteria bacterium]|nr:DEAD/DEAH box helicase [Deltaproteobacteria bacterium]